MHQILVTHYFTSVLQPIHGPPPHVFWGQHILSANEMTMNTILKQKYWFRFCPGFLFMSVCACFCNDDRY